MPPSSSLVQRDSESISLLVVCQVVTRVYSCTLGLAICVIVHPSLLTRIILTSALALIGTVFCLLPLQRYQHVFVRIATSASGAFGVVTSVALLSSISAWSDVWQRLWVSDGDGWGTDAEKGLSAAYCLMLLSGTACDWFLRRKLGENPDEVCIMSWYNSSVHLMTLVVPEMGQLPRRVRCQLTQGIRSCRHLHTFTIHLVPSFRNATHSPDMQNALTRRCGRTMPPWVPLNMMN